MAVSQVKLPSSAAALRDYLKEQSRTLREYVDGFGGTWGTLGRRLGIEAGITDAEFDDLHAGIWKGGQLTGVGYRTNPATGEREAYRNSGYHMIYAAPKEVSEMFARASTQAEADAIAQVVWDSAKVSFEDAVEGFARGVRKNGKLMTADVIAVPVMQFTARPTDATLGRGAPADPHLHIHVVFFAACAVEDEIPRLCERLVRRDREALADNLFALARMPHETREGIVANARIIVRPFSREKVVRTTDNPNVDLRKFVRGAPAAPPEEFLW